MQPKPTIVDTLDTQTDVEIRSVVDTLERALAEARAGEIHAIAISMVGPVGRAGYYWSNTDRRGAALVGAVVLTQHQLCHGMWSGEFGRVETNYYPDPPPQPPGPDKNPT